MLPSVLRAGVAPAALIALASSASGAFDVTMGFSVDIGHFDNAAPHYNLFPGVSVTNFTDDSHPGNSWQVLSPNGDFEGNQGTSSSTNFATIQDILDEANSGTWSLTITDGATGDVRSFEFAVTIDSALTDPDYLRALTVTNPVPGAVIPSTPTFEWDIDTNISGNPDAEYDGQYAFLFGPEGEFAPLSPADRSWSPTAAPLDNGFYSLYVRSGNSGAPQEYISIYEPVATDDLEELDAFSVSDYQLNAWHSVSGFQVPTPGVMALAGLGALVGARRRR